MGVSPTKKPLKKRLEVSEYTNSDSNPYGIMNRFPIEPKPRSIYYQSKNELENLNHDEDVPDELDEAINPLRLHLRNISTKNTKS